jgi:hypothetical protein
MALITLDEYKLRVGLPAAAGPNDAAYQAAIDDASTAVLNESDRDFAAPNVTEDRDYTYDGAGVLSIDDCETVNTVTFQNASTLPDTSWRAKREGPPAVTVYSWLKLPIINWGDAPQSIGVMGFEQNLDRFIAQPGGFPELTVTVNADWGWPDVPEDVKRAVAWTAFEFYQTSPSGGEAGGLASESVAEVAKSYFQEQTQQGSSSPEPLPARARALLLPYQRAGGVH